jgi:peptide/nickel transport system permease protein
VISELVPAIRDRRSAREWARLPLRYPSLAAAFAVLVVDLAWTVVPGAFTSQDPDAGVPAQRLQAPGLAHLFGTDELGRDVFTRVVYGTPATLGDAALAVAIALAGGALLGLLAGYGGRWVESLIVKVADVLLAIPSLLLALAVVSVIGFGDTNIALAVGLGSVATFTRVMRADVLRVKAMAYVEAGRASGVRPVVVAVRHVLPNAIGSLVALAALEFGAVILAISALSFLGVGAPPPAPVWGAMIAEGRAYISVAWWLSAFPGLAIAVTVVALNRLARAADRILRHRD